MISLIALAIIAGSILENGVSGDDELLLFKDHASALVNAAYRPFFDNNEIRGLARKCQPTIKDMTAMNALNLIIATMSLAEEEHRDSLVRIRDNDISRVRNRIPRKTKAKIVDFVHQLFASDERLVLVVLHDIHLLQHYELDPPYIAGLFERLQNNDKTIESLSECYRLLMTIYNNNQFFNSLLRGFTIERVLLKMERNNDTNVNRRNELQSELQTIINGLGRHTLGIPQSQIIENELEDFLTLVRQRYKMRLDNKLSSLQRRSLAFLLAAGISGATMAALVTAAGLPQFPR